MVPSGYDQMACVEDCTHTGGRETVNSGPVSIEASHVSAINEKEKRGSRKREMLYVCIWASKRIGTSSRVWLAAPLSQLALR